MRMPFAIAIHNGPGCCLGHPGTDSTRPDYTSSATRTAYHTFDTSECTPMTMVIASAW